MRGLIKLLVSTVVVFGLSACSINDRAVEQPTPPVSDTGKPIFDKSPHFNSSPFDPFWPDHVFDPARAAEPPDYSDTENWVSLPNMDDVSDVQPVGVTGAQLDGQAPVDVFFVHATGLVNPTNWTFDMNADSMTEENTQFLVANSASVFNACCNVYAPRYRQASLFTFFSAQKEKDKLLAFAYQDVEAAFRYYLKHHNKGRPFIIAGHSQGSYHGLTLLERVVSGTTLQDKLVAAYLVGGFRLAIHQSRVDGMKDIDVCKQKNDIGCVIHFDSFSERVASETGPDNVCVNPLSWATDSKRVSQEKHLGSVFPAGKYQVSFSSDEPTNMVISSLPAPDTQLLAAQCKNGILFISDLRETRFGKYETSLRKGSYHLIDYSLFYMNIRENAKRRVATFLER